MSKLKPQNHSFNTIVGLTTWNEVKCIILIYMVLAGYTNYSITYCPDITNVHCYIEFSIFQSHHFYILVMEYLTMWALLGLWQRTSIAVTTSLSLSCSLDRVYRMNFMLVLKYWHMLSCCILGSILLNKNLGFISTDIHKWNYNIWHWICIISNQTLPSDFVPSSSCVGTNLDRIRSAKWWTSLQPFRLWHCHPLFSEGADLTWKHWSNWLPTITCFHQYLA